MTTKNNLDQAAPRFFKRLRFAPTALAAALVASCVTVNVNFPESAVQRAADDFVQDLYKGTTAVSGADAKQTESDAAAIKNSMRKPAKKPTKTEAKEPTSLLQGLSLLSEAYAIDVSAEVRTNTPRSLELKGKMAGRIVSLDRWKQKGVVCETMQGTLKLASPAKAGTEAGVVAALVKAENNDREALYEEVVKANPGLREEVARRNFASAFRDRSPDAGRCD